MPLLTTKYSAPLRVLRILTSTVYFTVSAVMIVATQVIGWPLILVSYDYYRPYMDYTKQSFAILLTSITQWYCPTSFRIYAEAGVAELMDLDQDGNLQFRLPKDGFSFLIANHQIYTDWLYLWYVAYTAQLHGSIYIALKSSLKHIPLLGPGMQFYEFIFLARNWQKDQATLTKHIRSIRDAALGKKSPQGIKYPGLLLLFPEGTNMSERTYRRSLEFSRKIDFPQPYLQQVLLPRTRGLLTALREAGDSARYLYDCTIGYSGLEKVEDRPDYKYGQDLYTLSTVFIDGYSPEKVHLYFRRFTVADIPTDDAEFEAWVFARWREKEELMNYFYEHGHFPTEKTPKVLETAMRLRSSWEVFQIFAIPATALLLGYNVWKILR